MRVDQELAVLDADVDVRAEDQQLLRQVAHVLLDAEVALERRDLLRRPSDENGCVPAAAIFEPVAGRPAP